MLRTAEIVVLRRPTLLLLLLSLASCQLHAFSGVSGLGQRLLTNKAGRPFDLREAVAQQRYPTDTKASLHKLLLSLPGGNTKTASLFDQLSDVASKINSFLQKNFFLLGMIFAVSIARVFPFLGRDGGILRSELFLGKFGVTLIFLLSGLSLDISELKEAASNHKLNFAVQLATFAVWPFLVGLPLKNGLGTYLPNLLPPPLLDGILILTCLPTTVNMCIFLTSAAGGNLASSLCNAVISNFAGIFLTPALLLRFFGAKIQLPFLNMVLKLCNKVLLPVAAGQMLRKTKKAKDFYEGNSKSLKRLQEVILLGIVWNAFCNAFSKGMGLEMRHGLALLAILPILHIASLAVLFKVFQHPFWGLSRGETVAAMFCASHKTLAFGLPLVKTIFEGNPNLAAYCAPIMFIHPLQLVLGSLLVPKLAEYTRGEDDQT